MFSEERKAGQGLEDPIASGFSGQCPCRESCQGHLANPTYV